MLEAYTWPQSVAPGEPFALRISSDRDVVDIEVAREGASREVVHRAERVPARPQSTAGDAAATGCAWEDTLTIELSSGTRSGYHAVTVTAGEDRADAFVVVT